MTESWGLTLGVSVVIGSFLGLPAIPLAIVATVALQVLRGKFNASLVILAVVAALVGAGRSAMQEPHTAPADLAASQGARITVDSLPRTSAAGDSVLVTVQTLRFDDDERAGAPFTVLVWLPAGEIVAPPIEGGEQ